MGNLAYPNVKFFSRLLLLTKSKRPSHWVSASEIPKALSLKIWTNKTIFVI